MTAKQIVVKFISAIKEKIDAERAKQKLDSDARLKIKTAANAAYYQAKEQEEIRYQQERAKFETDTKLNVLKQPKPVMMGGLGFGGVSFKPNPQLLSSDFFGSNKKVTNDAHK